jgi:serine/threonine-protein kinase RsbW
MQSTDDVVWLELPARLQYLNVLGVAIAEILGRVQQLSDPQQTIYNIQLAVHEGCTNIVDHAYESQNGRITVKLMLDWQPLRLIIELLDTGKAFDFTSLSEPDLEDHHVRGYGIFIMQQLMDEVVYESRADHNYWRLVKLL